VTDFLQQVKEVEAAREDIQFPSFMTQLFAGEPDFGLLAGVARQDEADKAIGDEYCARLAEFLAAGVDADEIERTAVIPREVLDGMAELGCFGLSIPQEYGGLGLSETNYCRVLALVASHCSTLALLLSVHQSIGVPQPLVLFGTEEQKREWLPRLARGAISAFGLTEPKVGSDPAHMATTATLSDDGSHYLINGEKLWTTNSLIAEVIVVMAKVQGKITAFIVPMDSPGIEIRHRCEFMGCRGIENAWITFQDVRVPADNVIGQVGKGLKIALTTLNTGRIAIAALCLGMAKQAYAPTVQWSTTRETFGKQIGYHELNTHKVARMAAGIFAMEAVTNLVAGMTDRAHADFRVEAATAKLFCSEQLWSTVDAAMQLWGGRGYEKLDSLRARGEQGAPIEQIFRDARMYLIGEGASEILKLFIMREVVDPHIKRTNRLLGARSIPKLVEMAKLAPFYGSWYARRVLPAKNDGSSDLPVSDPRLAKQLKYVRRTSRRLARTMLYAMARHMVNLEQRQALVARLADIGVDLFVITAASLYASTRPEGVPLARQVFDDARARIDTNFRLLWSNRDTAATVLGTDVLANRYEWVTEGSMTGKETEAFAYAGD